RFPFRCFFPRAACRCSSARTENAAGSFRVPEEPSSRSNSSIRRCWATITSTSRSSVIRPAPTSSLSCPTSMPPYYPACQNHATPISQNGQLRQECRRQEERPAKVLESLHGFLTSLLVVELVVVHSGVQSAARAWSEVISTMATRLAKRTADN